MAEGSEQAAARAENPEAFKVEGFKERGGILRVEEDAKESADVKSASASYTPWFQHDAWFSDPGKSEHVAGGSNRDELLRVLESRSYTELRGMVQSDSLPLRSLYDKDSDFERLKCRAEFHYVNGEYAEAAREFLHVLGSYKIAPPRKGGGGLRFEILDALVRCYHKMGALSGPDAQVLVEDMKAAVGGQQHAVMHMLHSHFLRAAGRMDACLAALQLVVAKHPADPALWVQVAEAYRQSTKPRDFAALCSRRCLRFAVKMVWFCAKAVQCSVSLNHHATVLAAVRELCAQHPEFYYLSEERPPDAVPYFQELALTDAERAWLAQPEASAFEKEWLAGGGEEAATTMLAKAPDASVAEMSG